MLRTNTKKVLEAVKNHILEYYDIEDLKKEGAAVGGFTAYQKGVNLAKGGCFLCYNYNIIQFLKEILEETDAEADKYEDKAFELYCHLIGKAYEKLVK